MKRVVNKSAVSALALAAFGAIGSLQAAEPQFYVDARIGTARTDVSASSLENDFAKQGVDADVSSIDNNRDGYALALGWAVTEQLAFEVGYLDLGDVELRFSTTTTSFDLGKVHPESGDGFTAGVRYQYPLAAGFSAQARAGAFAWDGDYDTHRGAAQVDDNSESEIDLYWGIGAGYAISDCIGLVLEYQRIEFDRYPTEFVNLGAQWRFGL